MALSTIRRITGEDEQRMAVAARRLIARHQGDIQQAIVEYPVAGMRAETPDSDSDAGVIRFLEEVMADGYGDGYGQASAKRYLRRRWLAAFRRAVRDTDADSYGYGYIGNYVK